MGLPVILVDNKNIINVRKNTIFRRYCPIHVLLSQIGMNLVTTRNVLYMNHHHGVVTKRDFKSNVVDKNENLRRPQALFFYTYTLYSKPTNEVCDLQNF